MFRAPAQPLFRVTLWRGPYSEGDIMGNYFDADNLSHGFLLDKNGVFTTFDAPDAGTVPGSSRYLPLWNQCEWCDHGMVC